MNSGSRKNAGKQGSYLLFKNVIGGAFFMQFLGDYILYTVFNHITI